jgi:uncharacterized membrane protein
MNPALGASICLLGLVYPFAVYIGVERWPSAWLPAAMALLWLARALLLPANRPGGRWLPSLAVAGCLALAAVDSPAALRAYPVMMNALLLAVFGISLLRGQTVIERLARLRHADLPAAGVRYTRRITQAWCAFFLLNGLAAAILAAWGTWQAWAWYNGAISYVLMGALLAGEWLIRPRAALRTRSAPQ